MKDLNDPKEIDGWNTKDEAIPGLTCKDAAKYLGALTSGFRAMVMLEHMVGGMHGVVHQAIGMMKSQVDYAAEHKLPQTEADALLRSACLSIGQILVLMSGTDPANAGLLAVEGVKAMIETKNKMGQENYDKAIIRFDVKKAAKGIMIRADAYPMEDIKKSIDSKMATKANEVLDSVLKQGLKEPSNN